MKVGEDFHYPAGDWDGTGGETDPDGEEDERPQQSWRRRKRRAVMSYDPLKVLAGDLHIVIEVFRAVRPGEDEGEPHDARPSRQEIDIGSKISRAAPPRPDEDPTDPRALGCNFLFVPFPFLDPKRKEQTGILFPVKEFLLIPRKSTSSDLQRKGSKRQQQKGISKEFLDNSFKNYYTCYYKEYSNYYFSFL